MANPERGEVDLDVHGTRYRLALGMAGLRAIQRAVSTPTRRVTLVEVAQGAAAGDIEYLCAMIWGALQRYHPEIPLEGVDQILDDLGGLLAIPIVLTKINELMTATTADARDVGVLEKKRAADPTARPGTPPPDPMAGTTGTASTSRRARSA